MSESFQSLARNYLRLAAVEAYRRERWETSARLFFDAAMARGIVSRLAFRRALGAAGVAAAEVRGWLERLDVAVGNYEVASAAYDELLETSPEARRRHEEITGRRVLPTPAIDRVVDEAVGRRRLGR